MGVPLADLQPVDWPPAFGTFFLASSLSQPWGLVAPYPDNPYDFWWNTNLPAYSVYWMGPHGNAYSNAYVIDDVAAAAALAERRESEGTLRGFPHQLSLRPGQAVSLVDQLAEGALQFQGFSSEYAGRFDGTGVFLAQSLDPGGGQRLFLAPDALLLAHPSVGIEFGRGKKFAAGRDGLPRLSWQAR
jgi:hypothetical protein